MMANFDKDLSLIVGNLFDFAIDTLAGLNYTQDEDDTANIANPENYFPDDKDWVFGGPVLTHPGSFNSSLLMNSGWSYRYG